MGNNNVKIELCPICQRSFSVEGIEKVKCVTCSKLVCSHCTIMKFCINCAPETMVCNRCGRHTKMQDLYDCDICNARVCVGCLKPNATDKERENFQELYQTNNESVTCFECMMEDITENHPELICGRCKKLIRKNMNVVRLFMGWFDEDGFHIKDSLGSYHRECAPK